MWVCSVCWSIVEIIGSIHVNILLTGFAPFDGEAINPSWEAVRGFQAQQISGHVIHCVQLPTEFANASMVLTRQLHTLQPSLCLCVGQAGGRALISLEKVAINFRHARISDNAGMRPQHQAIQMNSPTAYFANYDFSDALTRLSDAGIPAEMSFSAGAFVCNEVFYALCQVQALQPQLLGTFVHIPFAPEQVLNKPGAPSMPRETVEKALVLLIESGLRGYE